MVKIYYDMDNTLALFSVKGEENQALEQMYEKGYFAKLPILDNAMETLASLMWDGYDVYILSACINSPHCKNDKMKWLEKYFNFIPKENIILCEVGENKAEIIGNVENCILVDDYHKNLLEWKRAGGIAVKKRSSDKAGYEYMVKDHMDIFDILEEMGL